MQGARRLHVQPGDPQHARRTSPRPRGLPGRHDRPRRPAPDRGLPERHRASSFVDYVCRGEAEESFPALVEDAARGPGARAGRDSGRLHARSRRRTRRAAFRRRSSTSSSSTSTTCCATTSLADELQTAEPLSRRARHGRAPSTGRSRSCAAVRTTAPSAARSRCRARSCAIARSTSVVDDIEFYATAVRPRGSSASSTTRSRSSTTTSSSCARRSCGGS